MIRPNLRSLTAVAAILSVVGSAQAQSLFERSPGRQTPQRSTAPSSNPAEPGAGGDARPGEPGGHGGTPPPATPMPDPGPAPVRQEDDPNAPARAAAAQLEGYSLMVVVPPKPRTFQKHDLIEIIINENSSQKIEQSLDTNKKYDIKAALTQFPSLEELLKFRIKNGIGVPAELAVRSDSKYTGDGESERKDRFTARIAAEVIDVKPNGNLVLEARKTIEGSGGDKTYMVLGGVCRGADITTANTIQSSQIANMVLKIEGEGDVKDAARKGLIPRVLETIFNF